MARQEPNLALCEPSSTVQLPQGQPLAGVGAVEQRAPLVDERQRRREAERRALEVQHAKAAGPDVVVRSWAMNVVVSGYRAPLRRKLSSAARMSANEKCTRASQKNVRRSFACSCAFCAINASTMSMP